MQGTNTCPRADAFSDCIFWGGVKKGGPKHRPPRQELSRTVISTKFLAVDGSSRPPVGRAPGQVWREWREVRSRPTAWGPRSRAKFIYHLGSSSRTISGGKRTAPCTGPPAAASPPAPPQHARDGLRDRATARRGDACAPCGDAPALQAPDPSLVRRGPQNGALARVPWFGSQRMRSYAAPRPGSRTGARGSVTIRPAPGALEPPWPWACTRASSLPSHPRRPSRRRWASW